MSSAGVRSVLVAAAVIALGIGLLGALRDTSPAPKVEALVEGPVFSTDRGDPIDAEFARFPDYGCVHLDGGGHIPSGTSCFDAYRPSASHYVVAIPLTPGMSAYVVAVMPSSNSEATVRVGASVVTATTRGRWFLAELEPGTLGPNNARPIDVDFDS